MKILHNARIHTLDSNCPLASVIVIDGERILAVGGAELLEAFPLATRKDVGGRTILPGLTDAHLHLEKYALSLQKLDLTGKTDEECACLIAERATHPTEWLLGQGWSG